MDQAFLAERIETTKALIIAYDDAILALATGNVQEYTLDTGQTRQTVKRPDLGMLQAMIDGLYNRLATLQTRATGCGTTHVVPSFPAGRL